VYKCIWCVLLCQSKRHGQHIYDVTTCSLRFDVQAAVAAAGRTDGRTCNRGDGDGEGL